MEPRIPSRFVMMTLDGAVELAEFIELVLRRAGEDHGLVGRVALGGCARDDLETLERWGRAQLARGAELNGWLIHAGQSQIQCLLDEPCMTEGGLREAMEEIREDPCGNLAVVLASDGDVAGAADDLLTLAREILTGTAGQGNGGNGGNGGGEPRLEACLRNLPGLIPDDGPPDDRPPDDGPPDDGLLDDRRMPEELPQGDPCYTEWLELRLNLGRDDAPGLIEQVMREQEDILGDGILEDHGLMNLMPDAMIFGEANRN